MTDTEYVASVLLHQIDQAETVPSKNLYQVLMQVYLCRDESEPPFMMRGVNYMSHIAYVMHMLDIYEQHYKEMPYQERNYFIQKIRRIIFVCSKSSLSENYEDLYCDEFGVILNNDTIMRLIHTYPPSDILEHMFTYSSPKCLGESGHDY